MKKITIGYSGGECIDRDEIAEHLSKQSHYIWFYTTLSPFSHFLGKNSGWCFADVYRRYVALCKNRSFWICFQDRKHLHRVWYNDASKDGVWLQATWCSNCRRQAAGGKNPNAGNSSCILNATAKARPQGRSIEIPGGWD